MPERRTTADTPTTDLAGMQRRNAELEQAVARLSAMAGDCAAFEFTGTAMMVIEDDMTISVGNRKMMEVTGYSPQVLAEPRKWTEFVHEDDVARMVEYHRLRREQPDSVPSTYEFRLRDPSGAVRSVLVNVNLIPGTRKSIVSLLDISDRKQAEDRLRESERRFKETTEHLPAIVCEIDRERRFSYVNTLGLKSFGYTPNDIASGLRVDQLLDPSCRAMALERFGRILAGETHGPQEYRMLHKDGAARDYLLDSAPILRDGAVWGLRTCLLDIHDLKQALQKQRESEERFRSIFAHSPIGIALFDLQGACMEANGSFCGMFGAPSGQPKPGLFDLLALDGASRDQLRSGVGVAQEAAKQADSGAAGRWLHWQVTPLGAEHGQPSALLAQVQDITERRRAESARLTEAREAAEQARRMLADLRKDMREGSTFSSMVSRSPQMRAIFDILPEMAQATTTVLVCGESGTGKELIARALHELSPRAKKPFVAINCSALPDNLLESELFGYKAGAFTDAKRDKPGKFSLAEGGTIFLDEIGDISPAMQAKLLRVLQEKTFEPLGATSSQKADVRIVTATNRDLAAMVKEGRFREDLYYRINVLRVTLPPLRERRCDVPLLCEHFVDLFNARYGKKITGVSPEALSILLAHDFPGNIRELENIIEHGFVFCKGGTIAPEHLPAERRAQPLAGGAPQQPLAQVTNLEELEKLYIESVLAESGGSRLKTAQRLGIHKATLFRKLKKLGIND
jgi:PAS domain S-box-containing protein